MLQIHHSLIEEILYARIDDYLLSFSDFQAPSLDCKPRSSSCFSSPSFMGELGPYGTHLTETMLRKTEATGGFWSAAA